jgi:hypothetical protein
MDADMIQAKASIRASKLFHGNHQHPHLDTSNSFHHQWGDERRSFHHQKYHPPLRWCGLKVGAARRFLLAGE